MLDAAVIFILLLANGFFALSELSLVSSRKTRLAAMAKKRIRGARTALKLSEHPEQFLSAVQVGITLVGIVAGAYGGAAFAERLGSAFSNVPFLGEYGHTIGYVLIVALLTYLSVVIGELVPKQIALSNPERLACLVAPPMKLIVKAAKPAVWILSTSSALVLRLLGRQSTPSSHVTEEELMLVMDEATKSGTIEHEEQQVAVRALRFADRPVTALMTPRMDVVWLRKDEPFDKLMEKLLTSGHGQLPLCEGTVDHVLGIIRQKEATRFHILQKFSIEDDVRARQLEGLMHPPVFVPENSTGSQALEIMRTAKTHFAIIMDEYGGTVGVLSNHDILESLVGFVAGSAHEEEPMVTRADGSLLVSGWVPVGDVYSANSQLCDREVESMPVAGFLIHRMGRIPALGETYSERGLMFEVVDKDGQRVDEVLVRKVEEPSADQGAAPEN